MADLRKLKKRNSLGAPPALEEASQNLNAPETAPAPIVSEQMSQPDSSAQISPISHTAGDQVRIDGRSLKRTKRTVQFATRVSQEFDDKIRSIAQRDGLLLVEVLERSLEAYEQQTSN